MGKYDPDPKRRKGKRGRVPPQLRAWVYRRKKKTTRQRRKPKTTTTRTYKRRTYNPKPKKRSRRAKARGFLGKITTWIDKYAAWIGGLAALGMGVKGAWDSLQTVSYPDPVGNKSAMERYWWLLQREYKHLLNWGEPKNGWNAPSYLKYKFMESAWSVPFWASLITWIACKLPLPFTNARRIQRPLGKVAGAALAVSTIGALVIPGCPDGPNGTPTSNPSHTSHGRTYVYGK